MPTPAYAALPERATQKELEVLIELNRNIIRHWKLWANATGPGAYERACREMAIIIKLCAPIQGEPTDGTVIEEAPAPGHS